MSPHEPMPTSGLVTITISSEALDPAALGQFGDSPGSIMIGSAGLNCTLMDQELWTSMQVECTVPEGMPGETTVLLETADGVLSDPFSWLYASPHFEAISPPTVLVARDQVVRSVCAYTVFFSH